MSNPSMRDERRRNNRTRVEVRWFVAGDVGFDLVDSPIPDDRRVDRYHLVSLSESSAWKRRGRQGPFEHKWRVGEPLPVVIDGLAGLAERWVKRRYWSHPPLSGPWIEVQKQVWIAGDCQIARLDADGQPWWTVSLNAGRELRHGRACDALGRWSAVLRASGMTASYPGWILAERGGRSESPALAYRQRASG
jgi:hypothetical protein